MRLGGRDPLRELGCAAVAHALGLDDVGLGGVMTGARGRALDGRRASRLVGKIDMRPPVLIPGPTIVAAEINTGPGLLAADIGRMIHPDRQRQFGRDLIGGVL